LSLNQAIPVKDHVYSSLRNGIKCPLGRRGVWGFGFNFLSIRFSFHDEMVSMITETVLSRIGHDIESGKKLIQCWKGTVTGDHQGRVDVVFGDDFVEVFRLSLGHGGQPEFIDEEQIGMKIFSGSSLP
jgi:hypothetical protein